MDPLKPQSETRPRIDPWDPNSATLAVKRIRTCAVNVVGDPLESATYTFPRRRGRLKTLAS